MKPLNLRASFLHTRHSRIYFCLFALTLFQLAATQTSMAYGAQDLDDVSIGGRITDETGAGIVGAKVSVVLAATNAERFAVTDGEGRYRLVELAPGAYTVRASFVGFAVEERARVETVAGQVVRLDFTLRPAGVAAEQIVTSEAPREAVDTTRTFCGLSGTPKTSSPSKSKKFLTER